MQDRVEEDEERERSTSAVQIQSNAHRWLRHEGHLVSAHGAEGGECPLRNCAGLDACALWMPASGNIFQGPQPYCSVTRVGGLPAAFNTYYLGRGSAYALQYVSAAIAQKCAPVLDHWRDESATHLSSFLLRLFGRPARHGRAGNSSTMRPCHAVGNESLRST